MSDVWSIERIASVRQHWAADNRYADVMRPDVEEAFATLTPTEQARAYSIFKLFCESQTVRTQSPGNLHGEKTDVGTVLRL